MTVPTVRERFALRRAGFPAAEAAALAVACPSGLVVTGRSPGSGPRPVTGRPANVPGRPAGKGGNPIAASPAKEAS